MSNTQGSGQANWVEMTTLADKISPTGGGGGTVGYIKAQLDQLQQSLDALAPQWRSDAASAFYSVNHEWQEDAAQLNKALMDIADQLRASATAYQGAVDESTTVVRNIGPR